MKIFAPAESNELETRVAIVPASVQKLTELGFEITCQQGLGERCGIADKLYTEAGAKIGKDLDADCQKADIVVRVLPPNKKSLAALKKGTLHISFLDPFNRDELLTAVKSAKASCISLEMIPRSTLAQKMDAISSQANIAGYASVILAAERAKKIFPMMMTPAGTISPLKVFILGIGVAGLQAIATAKRMGARVTAFDVRPEALEQAESLGAKALRIDLGETGSTEQGYAKELTKEQIKKQQEAQSRTIAQSDIVITTAKLFGRKSPILIKKDVVKKMLPGSLIIDLAAETGGNVEGTELDKEITTKDGVTIVGYGAIERNYPQSASQMFSSNIANLLEHFWDKENKALELNPEDSILKGCLLIKSGEQLWQKPS